MIYSAGRMLTVIEERINHKAMEKSVFASRRLVPLFGIITALVWGAAYPFIKLGLSEFGIAATETGSKTLFAGIRFTIAGLIVLAAAAVVRRRAHDSAGAGKADLQAANRPEQSTRKANRDGRANGEVFPTLSFQNILWLFLYALVNTSLHYFCFYIGVSNSSGSRASVLNSLGTFLLVFLACAVFPNEHLTKARIVGCAVGFTGLLFLNLGQGSSGAFTFMGDGMIILNGLFSALGGILARIVGKKMDALFMTGAGLFLGGLLLIFGGLGMGGSISRLTPMGLLDLAVLVGISTVAFSIYNQLLLYHPVGKVAIYNSLIPVFGIILSCMLLREPFLPKYLAAAGLVAAGVYIINREKE